MSSPCRLALNCSTVASSITMVHPSPSARSGDLLGNGEMLVMWTIEDPANSVGELVSSQQSVGFDYFALAMHPLGLYGVQPWTPLWQKATHNPHSACALLDPAVVFS